LKTTGKFAFAAIPCSPKAHNRRHTTVSPKTHPNINPRDRDRGADTVKLRSPARSQRTALSAPRSAKERGKGGYCRVYCLRSAVKTKMFLRHFTHPRCATRGTQSARPCGTGEHPSFLGPASV
jgi:hypothetical protein